MLFTITAFVLVARAAGYHESSHLVVLVHGYSGTATDLGYLRRQLEASGDVRVLACSCNEGRTMDGVAAGGRRVAREVWGAVVSPTPCGEQRRLGDFFECASSESPRRGLRTISFVGNSLGGLYARYALAELFDARSNRVAGLAPAVFATTATPHLGVRRGTTYGEALRPLAVLAGPLFPETTRTARDLVGATDVLTSLAREDRFLRPLGAFRLRRALAATRGDFMVPFRSALFTALDAPAFAAAEGSAASTTTMTASCVVVVSDDDDHPEGSRTPLTGDALARANLDRLGWSKCAVELASDDATVQDALLSALPLAHNKLVALERSGIRRLASPFERTAVGRPVMDDLARFIVRGARDALVETWLDEPDDDTTSRSE